VKAAPLHPRQVFSARLPRHHHREFSWGWTRRGAPNTPQPGPSRDCTFGHRTSLPNRPSAKADSPNFCHRLVQPSGRASARSARHSRRAARLGSHRGYSQDRLDGLRTRTLTLIVGDVERATRRLRISSRGVRSRPSLKKRNYGPISRLMQRLDFPGYLGWRTRAATPSLCQRLTLTMGQLLTHLER
jgi:hypothetical protein